MVFEKVKAILEDQFGDVAGDLTEATRIHDDLGADSMDVVDLIMSIEEEFHMEVQDEDIEKISTVGDLVAFIEEKM